MKSRLLVCVCALIVSVQVAYAQCVLPPWLSLREPFCVSVLMIDSITPRQDTLSHREFVAVPAMFEPYVSPSVNPMWEINTAPFLDLFRPLQVDESFFQLRSNFSTEARLARLANPLGLVSVADTLFVEKDNPTGMSPIELLRSQYAIRNPTKVHLTWDGIEDQRLVKTDMRVDVEKNKATISRIFAPDEDALSASIVAKPKEKVSYWKSNGEENMQFSQLAVSNWIKGGENSVSLTHDLRMSASLSKNKVQWDNSLIHKLGFTHTSSLSARVSTDELNLSSKFGYQAVNKWYYSVLSTFKTQMFRNYGRNDRKTSKPNSTLLSPAYIQFKVGMDYKKPNFSLLLSPFTSIVTMVADTADIDQTKYGVAADKRSNVVNGFSVTLGWKKVIIYGFSYSTNLELFYEYFKKDGDKRFDWENVFDLQFNRFLSTRFLFELRYFDNESHKFQLKENFSIAFKYSF